MVDPTHPETERAQDGGNTKTVDAASGLPQHSAEDAAPRRGRVALGEGEQEEATFFSDHETEDDRLLTDPAESLPYDPTSPFPPDVGGPRHGRRTTVRWAPDEDSPDYAHTLVAERMGIQPKKIFKVTPEALDLVIKASHFYPEGYQDKIVIALRGAELQSGGGRMVEGVDDFECENVRPNHKHFRCTVGFYDRKNKKLFGYMASTVPNTTSVVGYADRGKMANMLPNGCYVFRVGPHGYRKRLGRYRLQKALRLTQPGTKNNDGKATVLRSKKSGDYKYVYDHGDTWDNSTPTDNVHDAVFKTGFSSAGCITIKGRDANRTKPWNAFQGHFRNLPNGTRFDLLLVTGREVAIAAEIIAQGRQNENELVEACLGRLRVGSYGERVAAMQRKMNFSGSTKYFGAQTRERLVKYEKNAGVDTDGTFSPADDKALGWRIFELDESDNSTNETQDDGTGKDSKTYPDGKSEFGKNGGPDLATSTINPTTLRLVSSSPEAILSEDGKKLNVPEEGSWHVGPGLGQITFTPLPDFKGQPTPQRYQATDIFGRTASALIKLDMQPVNVAPQLKPDSANTMSGSGVTIAVLQNDRDTDGSIRRETLKFVSFPANAQSTSSGQLFVPDQGSWTVLENGLVHFDPVASFAGSARISYEVEDNAGAKSQSHVTVQVYPKTPDPVFVDDEKKGEAGQPVTVDVFGNDQFAVGGPAIKDNATKPKEIKEGQEKTPLDNKEPVSNNSSEDEQFKVAVPLSEGDLRRFANSKSKEKYIRALASEGNRILADYGINANRLRLSHFMAQIGHESGLFSIERESLKYTTTARLLKIFGHRLRGENLDDYLSTNGRNREEKLANKVYGPHPHLGNTQPGDGFRYRGGGLLQITGREAYTQYGRKLGLPLEQNPDLAAEPLVALQIAALFWSDRKLNNHADNNDIKYITYRINGGSNGLDERKALFKQAWAIWGDGSQPRKKQKLGLERFDTGPKVKELEVKLHKAGYLSDHIDEYFGTATMRALARFQHENNLEVTAIATPTTLKKLNEVVAAVEGRRGARGRTSSERRSLGPQDQRYPGRTSRRHDWPEGTSQEQRPRPRHGRELLRLFLILIGITMLAWASVSVGISRNGAAKVETGAGTSSIEEGAAAPADLISPGNGLVAPILFALFEDPSVESIPIASTSAERRPLHRVAATSHNREGNREKTFWTSSPSPLFLAGFAVLAGLFWFLGASRSTRAKGRVSTSAQSNERTSPFDEPSGEDGSHSTPADLPGQEVRFETTDRALARLGFPPEEFEEKVPVRLAPGLPEDVEYSDRNIGMGAESSDVPSDIRAGRNLALSLGRSTPAADVQVTERVKPFNVSGHSADYAVLMMFGGDNDLSYQVRNDVYEMAAGNAGGSVTMLGLADFDGYPASVIELPPGASKPTVLEHLGEIDTGDPEVLVKFLSRAFVSYRPEMKTAIGFWDHGTGTFEDNDPNEKLLTRSTRGRHSDGRQRPARRLFVTEDDQEAAKNNDNTRAMLHDWTGGVLTNLEAGRMLSVAFQRAGDPGGSVDMLFSDTCLNGMIEVLAELGDHAEVVVASTDTEPAAGWDYARWFEATNQLPYGADARTWATTAVDAFYKNYVDQLDQYPCTLAAFNSQNAIVGAFADLVDCLSPEGGNKATAWDRYQQLNFARARTQNFDNRESFDLIEFAGKLAIAASGAGDDELRQKAERLRSACLTARIANRTLGARGYSSEGLAFWFPSSRGSLRRDIETYERLRFARETGWSDYLRMMYGAEV